MFISLEELRLLEHHKPDLTSVINTILTTIDLSLLLVTGTRTNIVMTMLYGERQIFNVAWQDIARPLLATLPY